MAVDFPLSPLRRYLWDNLSEILHPDEQQQRRRQPTRRASGGVSSTWASGTGHEGFDGFRIELKKFSSGQSNPTFLLVVRLSPPSGASPSGQAATTSFRFVLRKKPASVKVSSAHAVEREFRILRALRLDTSSSVPVPRALLLCEDTTVIGTAFYVMEFVQGRTHYFVRMYKVKLHEFLRPRSRRRCCGRVDVSALAFREAYGLPEANWPRRGYDYCCPPPLPHDKWQRQQSRVNTIDVPKKVVCE